MAMWLSARPAQCRSRPLIRDSLHAHAEALIRFASELWLAVGRFLAVTWDMWTMKCNLPRCRHRYLDDHGPQGFSVADGTAEPHLLIRPLAASAKLPETIGPPCGQWFHLVMSCYRRCTDCTENETVGWDFYGDGWSFAMMREVLGIGVGEVRSAKSCGG